MILPSINVGTNEENTVVLRICSVSSKLELDLQTGSSLNVPAPNTAFLPFPPADIPSSVELKHVSMQSEQEDEEAGEVSGEHQEGAQEEEEEGPRPPVQLLSPPPHP